MGRKSHAEARLLAILTAGFALLVLLLVASVYVSIDAVTTTESDATKLIEEQRATAQLLNEVQIEENNLSEIFYALAAGRGKANRQELLARLDRLDQEIRRTTQVGLASSNAELWNRVRVAASKFVVEVRESLQLASPPSDGFYKNHELLIGAIASLAAANFRLETEAESKEMARYHARVRFSLILLGAALFLATAGAFLTVLTASRILKRLEWQRSELALLSSRTMSDQEETARRFSRELHDEFGQILSAIEANLVAIHHSAEYHAGRVEDCLSLVKDAIENTREMSQLFRPSILDDFGLAVSLRWLADAFQQRKGILVHSKLELPERLSDEAETQLFRITQEALTNVARHSSATDVSINLHKEGGTIRLEISDNGQGFEQAKRVGSLGLLGMRARARTIGGVLDVQSSPGNGVTIKVELPWSPVIHGTQDSYFTSR
jgi:signal transduction histidine kinase